MAQNPIQGNSLTARILRTMSIFGSIELLSILCAIIRTKLVALWIGAAGVGILSLFNTTISMLASILSLNIRSSAVREISAATADERNLICHTTNRLGIVLGITTTIIVAAISPLLSLSTFGSYDYTWAFLLLSTTMFAAVLSDSRRALLQSLDMLRPLAKMTVFGAVTSTIIAIPLFYFFRLHAIVPVLLIFSFTTMTFLFIPNINLPKIDLPKGKSRQTMKQMLKLGSYLTIASATTLIADYLLRIYLNNFESIETVGLFQAGNTIIRTYIGIIFTAIAVEYFPRLSSIVQRKRATQVVVSHQISVVTWLLMPIIVIFISADELIIRILYSEAFLDILPYVSIAIIGTILRGVSWCVAYIIIARGDGKAYIATEAISAVAMLVFSVIGWNLWGYAGLGIASISEFVLYTIVTACVCRYRYGFSILPRVQILVIVALIVTSIALFAKIIGGWWLPLITILPLLLFVTYRVIHHRKLGRSKA